MDHARRTHQSKVGIKTKDPRLTIILSPEEEGESSRGDHPASSPPAGTQGQSQGEGTGPANNLNNPTTLTTDILAWKYSPLKCKE